MLLDIHEPGLTPLPHAKDASIAVGIDLGTTNSVVAISIDRSPQVLRDDRGHALIPSVVHYAQDKRVAVGQAALAAPHAPGAVRIASIKRQMDNAGARIATPLGARSPVEISADILRHLRAMAERALGKPVTQAVITVPAYFDDAARHATKHAAQLAGLEVLRLVNEPTAAALAYGLDSGAEGIYAVYDLGGGTFDISLLKMEKGVFQVLATGGDTRLGGDDFDQALLELAGREATAENLVAARKIKEILSEKESVALGSLLPQTHGAGADSGNGAPIITRDAFEAAIAPLVRRTIAICRQALADAALTASDIEGVVLVGGGTRMPMVRRAVAEFFGKAPLADVDPDQVVALGAALQAEALTRGADHLLLDVTPLSLGLETMGGIVEKIIHRNSPIPASATQEFTTYQDGQDGMQFHIVQGERELADQCRSLARFELTGIPPMLAGMARIRVTFAIDADGVLSVSAQEAATGISQQVHIKPAYGLELETMEAMLRESMEHAREDITERLLVEARVEARRSLNETESALKADSGLLNAEQIAAIKRAMQKVEQAIASSNRDDVDQAAEALHHASREFAELRMNKAIATALHGRHVDSMQETE